MARKPRAPKTDLEREFAAAYALHGEKIKALVEKAKDLADAHGIPFGTYVPSSFSKKYRGVVVDDDDWDDVADAFSDLTDWVGTVADVDTEYWFSSTAVCERRA